MAGEKLARHTGVQNIVRKRRRLPIPVAKHGCNDGCIRCWRETVEHRGAGKLGIDRIPLAHALGYDSHQDGTRLLIDRRLVRQGSPIGRDKDSKRVDIEPAILVHNAPLERNGRVFAGRTRASHTLDTAADIDYCRILAFRRSSYLDRRKRAHIRYIVNVGHLDADRCRLGCLITIHIGHLALERRRIDSHDGIARENRVLVPQSYRHEMGRVVDLIDKYIKPLAYCYERARQAEDSRCSHDDNGALGKASLLINRLRRQVCPQCANVFETLHKGCTHCLFALYCPIVITRVPIRHCHRYAVWQGHRVIDAASQASGGICNSTVAAQESQVTRKVRRALDKLAPRHRDIYDNALRAVNDALGWIGHRVDVGNNYTVNDDWHKR